METCQAEALSSEWAAACWGLGILGKGGAAPATARGGGQLQLLLPCTRRILLPQRPDQRHQRRRPQSKQPAAKDLYSICSSCRVDRPLGKVMHPCHAAHRACSMASKAARQTTCQHTSWIAWTDQCDICDKGGVASWRCSSRGY